MEGTAQQRDNRTNVLSEEHVQSAIETVLANRVQSYEEFMSAFMVLTPDDVSQFSAQRSNERVEGQMMTSEGSEETSQLFQISPSSPRTSEQPQRDVKQVEELEIEELGEDFIDERESLESDSKKKSSKYIQVDNYLDEPDSESELLSDDDEIVDFDDSSSKYVASFDAETETESEAAKRVPLTVTPEMLERVNDAEGNIERSIGEPEQSLSLPDLYPGEVEAEDEVSSSPGQSVHITRLPSSTGTYSPSENDRIAANITDSEVPQADDVQPFSIDPDFDYDNVILTPKWEPGHRPPSGP
eukprot:XP_011674168.1 PREDICTED: uncharacterized protein LOC105443065 [Strongylocentrotus purpuratus]